MWGAFVGDFIGSIYETVDIKGYRLPLISKTSHFTDDTILTAATMNALLNETSFRFEYQAFARRFPDVNYGPMFKEWVAGGDGESIGNGAAMRVSPIGCWQVSGNTARSMAKESAVCSHDTEEAITAAQAVATAVKLASTNTPVHLIESMIVSSFGYSLQIDLDDLHRASCFSSRAVETVPLAIYIALQSCSFEDCMRKGLYVGGDTDTILAIAGSIAEWIHGIPEDIKTVVQHKMRINLPEVYEIASRFQARCGVDRDHLCATDRELYWL